MAAGVSGFSGAVLQPPNAFGGGGMEYDDLHLSRIQTAWSMVRGAHGDHTAVQSAQQRLLDRYGGAVRRYALAALRDEDAADEVFQEFALRFVRGDFGKADPERGRFRAFVKTVVYRLIVDYQRRQKKRVREGPMHSNIAEPAAGDDEGRRRCRVPHQLARRAAGPLLAKLADDERRLGQAVSHGAALPGGPSRFAFARVGRRVERRSLASRSTPARCACCCTGPAKCSPSCCWMRCANRSRADRSTRRSRS